MPPGSKKRRAARRKQQQQQQHASDDSQPNSPHPQGNGGSLHDLNGSTDPSDDDRDSPPMNANGAEEVGVEFVDAADLAPPVQEAGVSGVSEVRVSESEEVRVSEPEEVRVLEPEEVRVSEPEEVRVSEPAEEARVSEPEISAPPLSEAAAVEPAAEASAMPAVHVDSVSEEVVQAVEDKAVLSEDVVDVLVVSAVEKPHDVGVAVDAAVTLGVDDVGDESLRVEAARGVEGSEAAITEEAAPAPLIRRRAAWWNCCGLFDVVRGTEA